VRSKEEKGPSPQGRGKSMNEKQSFSLTSQMNGDQSVGGMGRNVRMKEEITLGGSKLFDKHTGSVLRRKMGGRNAGDRKSIPGKSREGGTKKRTRGKKERLVSPKKASETGQRTLHLSSGTEKSHRGQSNE